MTHVLRSLAWLRLVAAGLAALIVFGDPGPARAEAGTDRGKLIQLAEFNANREAQQQKRLLQQQRRLQRQKQLQQQRQQQNKAAKPKRQKPAKKQTAKPKRQGGQKKQAGQGQGGQRQGGQRQGGQRKKAGQRQRGQRNQNAQRNRRRGPNNRNVRRGPRNRPFQRRRTIRRIERAVNRTLWEIERQRLLRERARRFGPPPSGFDGPPPPRFEGPPPRFARESGGPARRWSASGGNDRIAITDCTECGDDIGMLVQCRGAGQPADVMVQWAAVEHGQKGAIVPLTVSVDGRTYRYQARTDYFGMIGYTPVFSLNPGDPLIMALQEGNTARVTFAGQSTNISLRGSRDAFEIFKAHCGWNNPNLALGPTGGQFGQPPAGQPPFGPPGGGTPQFGQPPAGQPPFGPPAGGAPQFGQPPAGQPPLGQPAGGAPQFGQPTGGQPPAGPPQLGQPPAGQPPFGPPAGGAPQFGQPPAGPPQFGQPPAGQPPAGPALFGQSPGGQPPGGTPQFGQPPAGPPAAGPTLFGQPPGNPPQIGQPPAGQPPFNPLAGGQPPAGPPPPAPQIAGPLPLPHQGGQPGAIWGFFKGQNGQGVLMFGVPETDNTTAMATCTPGTRTASMEFYAGPQLPSQGQPVQVNFQTQSGARVINATANAHRRPVASGGPSDVLWTSLMEPGPISITVNGQSAGQIGSISTSTEAGKFYSHCGWR